MYKEFNTDCSRERGLPIHRPNATLLNHQTQFHPIFLLRP